MDRNAKFLKRLSYKELRVIEKTLQLLMQRKVSGLDIKKLVGYKDVYRVRVSDIRIIFLDTPKGIEVLQISHRSDTTYKGL